MRDPNAPDRVRSFAFFVIAALYFFFAQIVAGRAANGLVSGEWYLLVERGMLLFLLVVGYGAMGRAFQGQRRPIEAMGLVFRPGWRREFGRGAALGWGMLIVSIFPMVLAGGLIVTIWTNPRQWLLLFLDLFVLAIASLAEEVAFRGYPFQRLIESIGPFLATLLLSAIFGAVHLSNPSASAASITITVFAGWLLSIAYLRTRALWFSWGWHFAWNVSMGVIFGLPISGLTRFSPVVQSNTVGPVWLTGGNYGPEGSIIAAIVLLAGLVVVSVLTRRDAPEPAQPAVPLAGGAVETVSSFSPGEQAESLPLRRPTQQWEENSHPLTSGAGPENPPPAPETKISASHSQESPASPPADGLSPASGTEDAHPLV
ncbi:MAG TPA: type II CAAX endopeptidase family protein [Acidobacteriaceae bacterium]|jgi:hypothetical protein|nr:type II CAAX endopeptidase family protein [Acidobacteriaceae bacterium]